MRAKQEGSIDCFGLRDEIALTKEQLHQSQLKQITA